MCRMLQEIELFLTVRHAVKYSDIGMLRRLIDPLAVVFFGAGQHNYGREMLYYRWLLSDVSSPELQHSILSSGLVNWTGKPGGFKAVDLGLEHLNASCKIEMQAYKNSTHDVETTFDRVCLSNTWMRRLRKRVESSFGHSPSAEHTTPQASIDVRCLAISLFGNRVGYPSTARKTQFDSQDIFTEGIQVLRYKVDSFNSDKNGTWGGYIDGREANDDIYIDLSGVYDGGELGEYNTDNAFIDLTAEFEIDP